MDQRDKVIVFLRIRLKKDEDKELVDEDKYYFYLEDNSKFIGVTPNSDIIERKMKLYIFSILCPVEQLFLVVCVLSFFYW